jgi:hypothetical protein
MNAELVEETKLGAERKKVSFYTITDALFPLR